MIPSAVAIPALAALLAGALVLMWQGAPWMFVAGVVLATGAPLAFVLKHRHREQALDSHPLVVSTSSGLGCVTVMVAAQRFGPGHGWALGVALSALILWMLWQRGQRLHGGKASR